MTFLVAITCTVILLALWEVAALLLIAALGLGLIGGAIALIFADPQILWLIPAGIAAALLHGYEQRRVHRHRAAMADRKAAIAAAQEPAQ